MKPIIPPVDRELLEKENLGIPIYGTLNEPIHALNIEEKVNELKKIHPDSLLIAVDASLGKEKDIGFIHIVNGPIKPGKGAGKTLPSFGNISILGVVDSINNKSNNSLYTIRLNFIMRMAEVITKSIMYSLDYKEKVV